MAIFRSEGSDKVYEVARLFREQALERDGSLLTPGHTIWSASGLSELRDRFILQFDPGPDPFLVKLKRQLAGAPDDVIQLMAEVILMHLLINSQIGGTGKREHINTVLGWMVAPVAIPSAVSDALDAGIAWPGTIFNTKRYRQVQYIIELLEAWKALPHAAAADTLGDPWRFRDFAMTVEVEAAGAQRNCLLHMIFPEEFERIMSRTDRRRIIEAFADLIGGADAVQNLDDDRSILQIRRSLAQQHGADFDFYDTPAVYSQWKGAAPITEVPLLNRVRRMYPDWTGFDDPSFMEAELDYKRAASKKAQLLLGAAALRDLIEGGQFDEVVARVKTIAQATNLLWLRMPQEGDLAILSRQELDRGAYARALYDLLHGDGDSPTRLARYAAWAAEQSLPCTWTAPTYLLMLLHPDTDYFVKPQATKWFLQQMSEDSKIGAHPTAAVYERILSAARALFGSLAQYAPADLMDVQGYVWTAYRAPDDDEGEDGPIPEPLLHEGMTVNEAGSVYSFIRARGFHFPDWLITDYVLSMAAKPLVILSGISGTGKTKLAQLLSEFVAPTQEREISLDVDRTPARDGAVRVIIRPSAFQHRRLTIPSVLLDGMVVPDPNSITDLVVRAGGREWEARLYAHSSARNFQVHMKPGLYEWLKANAEMGDWLELAVTPAEDDTAFELELSVVRSERRVERVPSERIAFLSVRPDWTDNRALLGYYNPLLQRYQGTELLRLLMRAETNPDEAHFIILDEMNLAKVEYYFSDFLSAMESETEMVLHDVDDEDVDGEVGLPPKRLRVPRNVFFAGTVNIDETTYMFSPKVLDRANVIEFNDVDLASYGLDGGQEADSFRLAGDVTLEQLLGESRKPTPDSWTSLPAAYKDRIRALHAVMQEHELHFGYRVANEIARYLNLTAMYVGEEQLDFAFDLQVLQKVLPKLSGSRAKLEHPLESLLVFLQEEDLKLSVAKVQRMLDTVRAVGFVSFVQ